MNVPLQPHILGVPDPNDDDSPPVARPWTPQEATDWVNEAVRTNVAGDTVIARLMQHGFSYEDACTALATARAGRAADPWLKSREPQPPRTRRQRSYLLPLSFGAALIAIAAFIWIGSYTAAGPGGTYLIPTGTLIWGVVATAIGVHRFLRRHKA